MGEGRGGARRQRRAGRRLDALRPLSGGAALHTGWRLAAALFAWLAGAGAQMFQPVLAPARDDLRLCVAALASAALGLALFHARRARVRGAGAALLLAGLALAGFGSTAWRASQRLAESLSPAFEGRTVLVTGVIASLPQRLPGATRFVFEVESAQTLQREPVALPGRLMIGWYHDERADESDEANRPAAADGERADVRAGQRWRLPLRLKRPHGSLNPGGFDYELWLFEQRVRAAGYVHPQAGASPQQLADGGDHWIDRLRQHLRDAIDARVPDATAAGVLAALAVGDEGAIGHADWQVFRSTGVPHLVVISGLHVTMIAWFAMGAVGWLWRRSAACMLWCPAPLAARWGGLLLAVGYALLAGWGVPAQRAVWMLAATTLLGALGLRWPWPLVLLAAAALVVLIDPWALLQPGFWLSFAAVALLMSSSPARADVAPADDSRAPALRRLLRRLGRHLGEGARTQAVATFGLAPLTLVIFRQISLVAFAANLVSIPLVTLVITPLALLGALLPPLWSVAAWVVEAWMHVLAWVAAWPRAVWTVPAAPAWAMALGLLAGALVMLPLPWRLRWLALPLALPLLWPAPPRPAAGRFELLAADIGQGTAVLLRTRSHLLLFDTGPQYGPDSDAGDRVLLPLLRTLGEGPLDLLMLSHSDLDHVGGAAAILGAWPVRLISSSLPAGHPLLQRGVPHRPCSAGQHWEWDGVRFDVLSPRAEALHWPAGAKPPKPNFLSCVLRVVDAQGKAALLTGDAEAPQEAQMLATYGAPGLRADVLIVPHHGSRTSSSAPFLDAVRPRVAVVQAGYRNRFGHPAPDVVARYDARGIAVVRSDRCGAWQWRADAASCERDVERRYWQFVP
jgi:competence protein ComEC